MNHRFNKFERVAGLFVIGAIAGVVLTAFSVAVRQGWFATKIYYFTEFESGDGVHPGTEVQMAGLRAGAVESVDLQTDNKIRVGFYVLGKFQPRIRKDSTIGLVRPFIIGDRVLDISVGSENSEAADVSMALPSHETMDIMTLLSGKTLDTHLERLTMTLQNLAKLVEALSDKNHTEALLRVFDRLDPLLANVDTMATEMTKLSRQATNKGNLQTVVANLATTTAEINKVLPDLNKDNPDLAKDTGAIIKNLSTLTHDFKALGQALNEVGPELPQASRRAVEALNETVILMKAMQKSLFMRGSVQEVREEEATKSRQPASVDKP